MKLKKIIGLCRRRKTLILCNSENGTQWISDGQSLYPMYNTPFFTEKTIFSTFDVTEKQRQKIFFLHEPELPGEYDLRDATDAECRVEQLPMGIHHRGRVLLPFQTSVGIAFVDAAYLEVYEGAEVGYMELYERATPKGNLYFAVKIGLELRGVVLPQNVLNDDFVNAVEQLAQKCAVAWSNAKESENHD